MEVVNGNKNWPIVLTYEALGTAFLLICINWSRGNASGITVGILISIVTLGWASGGHFNPAVTIGVLIKETYSKRIPLSTNFCFAFGIILAQLVGACLGCICVYVSISPRESTV
jgi:glycerol uptake facilitator-like aquaporin